MRPLACLVLGGAAALGAAACRPAQQAGTSPARVTHAFAWRCDPRPGVIRGDLARAQRSARELLDHCTVRNAPTAVASQVTDVASLARSIAEAPDLRTAALHTARLARACGTCHQATSTSLSLAVVTTPEPGAGEVSMQMRRHVWASDRMWEGLIGPSDPNWSAGAAVLRDPAPYTAQATRHAVAPQTVVRIADDLRDLGARAGTVAVTEREHVYGEFLAGCAGCHTLVGGVGF